MAMEFGNLLGAAANLTTAFGKDKSLKSFLHHIDDFGVQVNNNFEVNIAGFSDITFFAQSISFGGIQQQFETLYYDGRSVPIPTYIDYEHSGSMTILNDANGYIYAAISNFLMGNSATLLDNGVQMTIKCLTGDKNYKGATITFRSVRFDKLDGLNFDYSGGEPQKFSLTFQYLDFTATPGALSKVGGVFGAVNSLIS